MKITKHETPPVPPPPATYTLELSQEDAERLRFLIGFTYTIPSAVIDIGGSYHTDQRKLIDWMCSLRDVFEEAGLGFNDKVFAK